MEPNDNPPPSDDDSPPDDPQLQAFIELGDRLAGFDEGLDPEFMDGFITGVLAGPRAVPVDEWLPRLVSDEVWQRVFADPQDHAQARAVLAERVRVIRMQLDPEALLDEPDTLRLAPVIMSWDEAARAEVVERGAISADEAADQLVTGAVWVEGFLEAIRAFPQDWPAPEGEQAEEWFDGCMKQIIALTLDRAGLAQHLAEEFPGEEIGREQLVDEALFAVQDLRCYWVENAPRPATRRVEATPGRNDLCPCGSGRKYKKCHGAN